MMRPPISLPDMIKQIPYYMGQYGPDAPIQRVTQGAQGGSFAEMHGARELARHARELGATTLGEFAAKAIEAV